MNKKMLGVGATAVLVMGFMGTDTADARPRSAKTTLVTALGHRIGKVTFLEIGRHTEVRVTLNSGGLTDVEVDVFHGFHIHANNDDSASPGNGSGCVADAAAAPSTWFTSADGHFNPTGESHAHHVGDMPVLYFNSDGSAETRFRLDQIKPADIIGKVVILHAGPDNFNNIPLGDAATQYKANSTDAAGATARTGNAGDRIACGVITP
jgi:Cu-Zn family superoxide dismutase